MLLVCVRLRRGWLAVAAGVLLLFASLVVWLLLRHAQPAQSQPPALPHPVILLDPGHGGEDGGAIGVGGVVEKDLNLPLTLKIHQFLTAMGFQTRLTRRTDIALPSPHAGNLRERKTSDILNRFAMMNQLRPQDLFVSVHMNQFPGSAAHGTQVFYSANLPQSAALATCIQARVKTLLQPQNTRAIKPSTDHIYLLFNAQRPAVLVECGFLSNPEDARMLQDEGYQNQLAFAIAAGIADYAASASFSQTP